MRVLVTTASRHEATREIAEAIRAGLAQRGIDAESRTIDEVTDLVGYDAVVLGSAIYMGRWLKPARQFAEHNGAALTAIPVWLFSCGPLGQDADRVPEGAPVDIAKLKTLTGAREHRMFPGRLDRERLGFAEKAVAKAAHASEGDPRNWSAIDGFADPIAKELTELTAAHSIDGGARDEA